MLQFLRLLQREGALLYDVRVTRRQARAQAHGRPAAAPRAEAQAGDVTPSERDVTAYAQARAAPPPAAEAARGDATADVITRGAAGGAVALALCEGGVGVPRMVVKVASTAL